MADSKIKIMIVEDEGIIAMDLKDKLTDLGYEVTSIASNYEDAIIGVEKNKPNFMLMDVNIQGTRNGIETALYVKDFYQIPSLFMTAYTDHETREIIANMHPIGILSKPFDESKFQAIMLTAHI